jgi:hypothetical protein
MWRDIKINGFSGAKSEVYVDAPRTFALERSGGTR